MDTGTTAAEFERLARQGDRVAVTREILADTETPVSAFLKVCTEPHSFLLESVEGGEKWGRYSFLGTEPTLIFSSKGNCVRICRAEGTVEEEICGDPLSRLQRVMNDLGAAPLSAAPRFSAGAVGYLAYDMVRFFERLPAVLPDDLDVPDSYFLFPERLMVFDNVAHRIKILVNVDLRRHRSVPVAYNHARGRIEEMVERLSGPVRFPANEEPKGTTAEVAANVTREDYMSMVERAQEHIRAGDIIQVVLAQRFEALSRVHPFNIYRALRVINPSPYMFYLQLGEQTLVGASPEVMARVERGELTVRPIAGTRPRGGNEVEDKALERELLSDPKELAEHIMLLDLGRNDVGRVCRVGSVKVTERLAIERYSHVMHIVSNVTGRLDSGKGCFDALRATFPAGTLTGAPKIRAMEIIEELEPVRRGVYGGAVGYFDVSGNMDMCIAIRTLLLKGGKVFMQAGAGVVADSDPEREHLECVNKAKSMVRALELAREL